MSGPWEEYPSPADKGPWAEYAPARTATSPAPQPATKAKTLAQLPKVAEKQTRMDRVLQGIRDPIDGAAQLLVHALPDKFVKRMDEANNWLADKTGLVGRVPEGGIDQQIKEREAAYQAARRASAPQSITSLVTGQQADPGFDGYRLIGNVLSPANLAIAARAPAAVSLAGRMGVGAAAGAATAAMAPVTSGGSFAKEKAKQVGIGAVGGAALPVITNGIARVVAPNAASKADLKILREAGVRPTIGQTLGGRWNTVEEKLQSVPILGDAISNARARAMEQFNAAAINRATGKVGQKVERIGQDGVHDASKHVSTAYDDALSSFSGIRLDNQFAQEASQLQSMASNLTPDMQRVFEKTYRDIVVGRVSPNGTLLPETFKKIDSELGRIGSQYGKSAVASEKEAGAAVKQLREILREQAKRSNPAAAQKLKAADAAYANLVRVEGAAKAAHNNNGVFTPAQLNMAIRTADDSVRGRNVAHGTALMQDLGNAAQTVLGNRVPNSGTTDRALMAGGAGFMINPLIPAGLLGGASLYTSPVQRLLTGAVSARPQSAQAVSQALQKATPMAYPLSGQVGLGLLYE